MAADEPDPVASEEDLVFRKMLLGLLLLAAVAAAEAIARAAGLGFLENMAWACEEGVNC